MSVLRSTEDKSTWQGSLTPVCIIVYLVIHAIWKQGVNGPYSFAILRLLFLIGIAGLLIYRGKTEEIWHYFIGRFLPTIKPLTVVLVFFVMAVTRIGINWWNPYALTSSSLFFGECVIAPINEEMIFRGIFLCILLQYMPQRPYLAIMVGALVYTGAHNLIDSGSSTVNMKYLTALLWYGVLLGWIYFRFKSVPFCMICHTFLNTFAFIPFLHPK